MFLIMRTKEAEVGIEVIDRYCWPKVKDKEHETIPEGVEHEGLEANRFEKVVWMAEFIVMND